MDPDAGQDDRLYTIGELAQRSGISVRTIRFYSDTGLVPPAGRSEAGYRLYDDDGVARLDLIGTLRALDIDLASTRRVLAREVEIADVLRAHAAALDTQIRVLRLRRAVLGSLVRRQSNPEEIKLMHNLAQLTSDERQRIVDDFLDHIFDGLDVDPTFVGRMRSARPALPDDPTPEQVDAWIELAGLVGDPEFRGRVRRMSERHAADAAADAVDRPAASDAQAAHRNAALVAQRAGSAVAGGIEPGSAQAEPIVDELVGAFAAASGRAEDPETRAWLAETIETFADPRVDRYWELLGLINGWPARPSAAPAWTWLLAALRAGTPA
ncbi:MAG TPA: MerR family transcriptional regulator [Solirubrobacteraceae bacterium]|nr:MerR family transcriptional regulator [Solirubrobacteraceae bacterium]